MTDIRIKRGDSLILQGLLTDDYRVPVALGSAGITGQVRDVEGNVIDVLQVTVTAQTGVFTATVADTSQWPTGALRCDFKVAIAGLNERSPTMGINVDRSVTP